MPIRAKLLVALLAAVLIPLGFAAVVGYQSTVRLGRHVAADQRELLLNDARAVLLALTRKNLDIFTRQAGAFTAAAQLQADGARRLLGGEAPQGAPVFTARAFQPGGAAKDLAPSSGHLVLGADGVETPALVSFSEPAVYLAPGASMDDAIRLGPMREMFRSFRPAMGATSSWQFVTLGSGVHMVYPGHGLLPPDYDGRTSPVYLDAIERPDRPGSPPSVDPATGQTVVGMAATITDGSGAPVGVTGVLARIDVLLGEFTLETQWGRDAETGLVSVDAAPGGGPRVLTIGAGLQRWVTDAGMLGVTEFRADDPADTRAVIDGVLSGEVGSRVVGISGERVLCCFGGVPGGSLGLLTLVPVSSVSAIADRAVLQVRERAVAQLLAIAGGVAFFAAVMTVAAFLGARAMTRPLGALVAAIRRLAEGDLEARAEVRSGDELGELAGAFNAMVPRLRDQMRMRQSLGLAQEVQRGLLPASPPVVEGFDIAGVSRYCDETGGDYYDFLDFDRPAPGSLTVALGDVSGHGVAAALLMATARALIRMRNALPGGMGDRLGDINRHLARDVTAGRFMTLMVLRLDRAAGTARWAGAGHDPVIVYDAERAEFSELAGEDIPLGVSGDWQFHERESRSLRTGQVLVLGTDGIWEAANARGERYGKERLRACIRRHAPEPAGAIADAVLRDVQEFIGAEAQRDDVTMVVIKVTAWRGT